MNLLALALYLLACGMAARAHMTARKTSRAPLERVGWAAVALGFLLVGIIRLTGAEDAIRVKVRMAMRASGEYAGRAQLQSTLVSLGLVLGVAIIGWVWWRWSRRPAGRGEWLTRIGLLAIGGYVPLYALRLISLHNIDKLLYLGPVHPNWLIDGALAATACLSAFLYVRLRTGALPPP